MIDKQVFANWMTAFGQRFDKALGAQALGAYYAILSSKLTTEQFNAAAERVFQSARFNAWPAPVEFLDAVSVPVAVEASMAWEAVQRVLATHYPPYSDRERLSDMELDAGVRARLAFQMIGGIARWRTATESDMLWLRKEFIAAFPSATEVCEQQARSFGPASSAVAALVGDVSQHMESITARRPAMLASPKPK